MDGFRPVVIEEGNIHIWRAPFLAGQSNNAPRLFSGAAV